MLQKYLLFLFVLLASKLSYANYPAFDLSMWPTPFKDLLLKSVPELNKKNLSDTDLEIILKKAQKEFNFENLQIKKSDKALFLVGTLSSKIDEITFSGLKDIDQDEAFEVLALNLTDANKEEKLNNALDRLQSYFKNSGYRKARVTSRSVLKKNGQRELKIEVFVGNKTKIDQVLVEGLPQDEKRKIERYFNWFGLGDILSDAVIKKLNLALRESLNDLGYYKVNIPAPTLVFSANEQKAKLIFKLVPQQKYKIVIQGQKGFSESYLANEVLQLPSYTTSEQNFGAELVEKLKLFYVKKGYAQIDIPYFESKTAQAQILTFNVIEGPVYYLDQITFQGNLSKKSSEYKKRLLSLASDKLQSGLFIKEDLDQAVKNLVVSLQNEGFVSAKLNRTQVGFDNRKKNSAYAVIVIDEGPQVYLDSIKISGNSFFSENKINTILNLKPHSPLSLLQLELALNELKSFYASQGFIEFKIISENKSLISYNDNLSLATLNIELEEGPQVKVSSILIEGNAMTHAKLILAELDFKEGDLLTPAKLEESVNRLQKTGHFSSSEIYTLEANTPVRDRTVVIRVIERNPGIATVGLGINNEYNYTLKGFLGVAYRNLGGWGRGLSLRAEGQYNPEVIKYLESKLIFGYLEPYLFDTRTRFRLNYTSARSISDFTIRKVTISNQAVWSLEQDFTSNLTGIYEVLNISNFVDQGINPEDQINFNYNREDLVISTTGPTLDFDFRDNILNPSKGLFSRLSAEYSSSAIGNHNVDDFYRLTGQLTVYTPLQKNVSDIVWAQSFRLGFLKNIESTSFGIPFDKKGFVLGGRSTLRGFESGEFYPGFREIGASYKIKDKTQYYLIKSELRFPLLISADLSGAFFYDGGEVKVDDFNFSDPYRDSIGIGLRYNTPVGPLNLEYARKLDKKSYESDGAFHLSVGVF